MKKFLLLLLSLLLVGSIGNVAFGVLTVDPDDSLLDPYEITGAEVTLFNPVITEPGEIYLQLNVQATGGKLPGVLLLEMDVDGDTATGGNGMPSSLNACNSVGFPPGSELKPLGAAGVDWLLFITLDAQSNAASSAWCDTCSGPGGMCYTRTNACGIACGGTNCFEASQAVTCKAGDANCFRTGITCQDDPGACDNCLELNDACSSSNPCAYGKIEGEWYVASLGPAQQFGPFVARGRVIMPLPPKGGPNGTATSIKLYFPYSMICEDMKAFGSYFDLAKALDANFAFARWQVSFWENGQVGGDDFMNKIEFCAEGVDVIPDAAGTIPVTNGGNECAGDFEKDGDVDGTNAIKFKGSMGRKNCP